MNSLVDPETKHKSPLAIIEAIAEAIRDLGNVPSGHLYAQLCGAVTLNQYEGIISILIDAGLVRRASSHLLTWIGPKGGAA